MFQVATFEMAGANAPAAQQCGDSFARAGENATDAIVKTIADNVRWDMLPGAHFK